MLGFFLDDRQTVKVAESIGEARAAKIRASELRREQAGGFRQIGIFEIDVSQSGSL